VWVLGAASNGAALAREGCQQELASLPHEHWALLLHSSLWLRAALPHPRLLRCWSGQWQRGRLLLGLTAAAAVRVLLLPPLLKEGGGLHPRDTPLCRFPLWARQLQPLPLPAGTPSQSLGWSQQEGQPRAAALPSRRRHSSRLSPPATARAADMPLPGMAPRLQAASVQLRRRIGGPPAS
jgi:hypothetical protein